MTEKRGSIPGPHDEHSIAFYGLSTCIWCRKTRQLLEDLGVKFDFVYVDLLHGQEREEATRQVRRWNPSVSFPTVVVDDFQCIVGYRPEEIKKVLGL